MICSTITLRYLPLDQALGAIAGLGFTEIDLGALPGVCDHVPYELTAEAVREVAASVDASGLTVRSVNADVGDLNRPLDAADAAGRREHADRLIELCHARRQHRHWCCPTGPSSTSRSRSLDEDLALVAEAARPVDRARRAAGLELWVEAPHFFRLCYDLDRAEPWPVSCHRIWA